MYPIFNLMEKNHLLFIGLILVLLLASMGYFIHLILLHKKIEKEGIKTMATVIRCESDHRVEHRITTGAYIIYVKFIGDDNKEHETCCRNTKHISVGTRVEIKFLPKKYKHIILIH